jgi:hypothetical protein
MHYIEKRPLAASRHQKASTESGDRRDRVIGGSEEQNPFFSRESTARPTASRGRRDRSTRMDAN